MKFSYALLVWLVPVFLLAGCGDDDDEPRYDRTPGGFLVQWIDRGAISTGWTTKAALYAEFDVAMERVGRELLRDHGVDPATTRIYALGILYILHDHVFFWTSAGPATGAYWPYRTPEIAVAYWPYGSDPDPANVPATAPAWTVYQGTSTGTWYWGIYDPANMYAALGYEVGHRFGYKLELAPREADDPEHVSRFLN